jgi:hypothetical protein
MQINKYFLHTCMYSTSVNFSNVCLFHNAVNSVDTVPYSFQCLLNGQSHAQVCQGQTRVCVRVTARLPNMKLIPQLLTSARCLGQMSAATCAIRIEIYRIQQFTVRKFRGRPLNQTITISFHIFSS